MRLLAYPSAYLAGLVLVASVAPPTLAATRPHHRPQPSHLIGLSGQAFPRIQLAKPVRGAAVVDALGQRLHDVAAFYGCSGQQLCDMATKDRSLHADSTGRLLYACEGHVHPADPGESETVSEAAPFPENQTFLLHSRPGATKVIYLDFDGHTTSGTSWNSRYNSSEDFDTPPFDTDGDPDNFSSAELERIQKIWQRVIEDFAMFDVDVTTEDPGADDLLKTGSTDANYGIRVCIGGSSHDWYGSGAGGVAYIGSFSWGSDTPCYAFSNQLGNGREKSVAEAISHEVGHTLGLFHDGIVDGASYYGGHGSGSTSWAPIMGVGYSKSVTQWSNGEYTNADNTEDDLDKMQNYGITYRADDHGNTPGSATQLPLGTTLLSSGVIEQNTDIDMFAFQTGTGTVTLTISVAIPSPNLDVEALLYDQNGQLILSTNPPSLGVTLQTTLDGGTYFLALDGVGFGDPDTGYSDYSSLGAYSLTGNVPNPAPNAVPPAPPANLRFVDAN